MKYTLLLLTCLFSGCTTIYFDNGEQSSTTLTVEETKWHHNMFYSLYEFSEPVSVIEECDTVSWQSIKVQQTFGNWYSGEFVDFALNMSISAATNSIFFFPFRLWSPRSVDVLCIKEFEYNNI